MIFLMILELVLLVIVVLAAINFFNIVFRGFAPFFSAKPEVIATIINDIKLTKDQEVYELGAGTAKFLRGLEAKYPQAKLIGVEYSWFPYLLTKIRLTKAKSKIDLRREDLFKTNLSRAALIYCYLAPDMMVRLSEKIQKECRPGTIVVSYLFSIPNLPWHKTLEVGGNKIYFYQL